MQRNQPRPHGRRSHCSDGGVDRTTNHSALPIGARVGRYQIVSVLGQGAFGITYRARDTHLERDVAIKEYLPALLAARPDGIGVLPRSTEVSEDFFHGRRQFLDEAKTIARLGHVPAVVRVHDFLEANGTGYAVMQLLEGESLSTLLRRVRRLPPAAIDRLLPLFSTASSRSTPRGSCIATSSRKTSSSPRTARRP